MTSGSSNEREIGLLEVGHETSVLLRDAEFDSLVTVVHASNFLPVPPSSNDFILR